MMYAIYWFNDDEKLHTTNCCIIIHKIGIKTFTIKYKLYNQVDT